MRKLGRFDFIKTENIVPIHKTYVWKYEQGYNGQIKELKFNIWPYLLEEKLEVQSLTKKMTALSNGTESEKEQSLEMANEIINKAAYYILKKEDKDVSMETVEKIPTDVKNELMLTALEFEGFTREQMDDAAKKAINVLQK